MKKHLLLPILLAAVLQLAGQNQAFLFRQPDVSATQIAFVFGDDIWIAPKQGGQAVRISSPPGPELLPRFSPDGKTLAFSGNYDGNLDIYTIPVNGGIPSRITHHGMSELIQDWFPDGKALLYTSSMNSGKQRFSQFYKVPATGGLPEKMPPAYGEFACFSPDAREMAFVIKSQANRTWKRYRGGTAGDIYTFDLKTLASENITHNKANNEFPMWHGKKIYYLSDNGPERRMNIWSYDLDTKKHRQVTNFKDFDINFPAKGPDDIVFTAGGKLYLLSLTNEKVGEVNVQVSSDLELAKPRMENVRKLISSYSLAPDGNRLLVGARGEVFNVPAQKGYVANLTQNSGSAERYPAWSPDGRYAAYWSDKSGEYQLVLQDLNKPASVQTLTKFENGFRYNLFWSPDSRKLAFVDQAMNIQVFDLDTKVTTRVDKALDLFEGGLSSFQCSWSSDSRWLTWSRSLENSREAIFLYDYPKKALQRVTSGFYSDQNPVFDKEGKYLYFVTGRDFNPEYSDFENTFIYHKSKRLACVPLRKDVPSPTAPQNDTVALKSDKPAPAPDTAKSKPVNIDLDGFESRVVILPPPPGDYVGVYAGLDKIIYGIVVPAPPVPGAEASVSLRYYDLKAREDKTIIDGINNFDISFDGKKVLAIKKDAVAVVNPEPDQKMDKPVPLNNLEMNLVPREEWQQIFNDVWRIERDYFYEKEMHGVDWEAMRKRYGGLIPLAATRSDVNFIIGELIGELNASHTYRGGGESETPKTRNTGYLGIDWAVANGYFQIKRIIRGAPWDTEVKSPLSDPSLAVEEGDYVLAVNGIALDVRQDPWTHFEGLAGTTIQLTVSKAAGWDNTRTVNVTLMGDETRLRNLAWIEENRQLVDKASGGKIGYIYVPSTGIDGQNELVRMFYAQWNKAGLIVDERFNNGGQIPDRFIELLNRKPLAFWAVRDGQTWQWPPVAHFGPKAMLINGWSGSGGDAFPDYFRKAGLGPLIGTRTWGGLIGISGCPSLIDGGTVTVPTFRMYNPDGTWFKEGYGVEPDIEVPEDPTALAKGKDPQLERAIEEVKKKLQGSSPIPPRPAREDRSH